jgi:hypothetical protein
MHEDGPDLTIERAGSGVGARAEKQSMDVSLMAA